MCSSIKVIEDIYRNNGFSGKLLQEVVNIITEDEDRWVGVMMKDKLMMSEETKSPLMIGFITYISFMIIGLIPLILYVWDFINNILGDLFVWTSLLTSFAFILIEFLKTYVTQTSKLKGILETLTYVF